MIEFALAVFFLIITPGPGVLSLAGVGSAYGYRTGLSYLMGLWIGHNTVVMLVISGIAATALAVPWLRVVRLMLQAINPKAYAVSTALFSGFAFMPEAPATETIIKIVVMNILWLSLHLVWLWVGVTLRRLDLAPGTQRWINYAMALSMLLVVALAIYAQM